MRTMHTVLAGMAAVVLSASLAACGGDDDDKKPIGDFKSVTGLSTSIALDPGFVTALGQLKLRPGLIGDARMTGTTVTFPITGGNAKIYRKGDATPAVTASLEHADSGLTLTSATTKVDLSNFVLSLGKKGDVRADVSVGGKSAAKGTTLFDVDVSKLKQVKVTSGSATLTGAKVELSSAAATLLDRAFKTDVIRGGLPVGTATIKAIAAVPAGK